MLERELTAPHVQLTVGRGQFPRTRIGIVHDSMQVSMRRGFCTLVLFIKYVSVQDFDLGSGTAESHGGAMEIVAEYEIRESEVEVVEEEKQPWH